jgi:hypothetical protein
LRAQKVAAHPASKDEPLPKGVKKKGYDKSSK